MKSAYLLAIPLALLLTACTDIRSRISPDILAADVGKQTAYAMHASGKQGVLRASAAHPDLLCDALQNAAGAEVSTGHLTLLLVSGDAVRILPDYLQRRWIAPTCAVVCTAGTAPDALLAGSFPDIGRLDAAVHTGQLPSRTADAVTGDLWGGSGITALQYWDGSALTLQLCDGETAYGLLSEDACRGLALLGNRWERFAFCAGDAVCELEKSRLHIAAEMRGGQTVFTVCGQILCKGTPAPEAGTRLREMLLAALNETARDTGADLTALREAAVGCGLPGAAEASQAQWREMLRSAAYAADFSLLGTP